MSQTDTARRYGVAAPEEIAGLTGLEVVTRLADGRLPGAPMAQLLEVWPVTVEFGRVVFEGRPGPQHRNPMGLIHGGWALTLIDTVAGCAAHTTLDAGVGYTTIETKANFDRPILSDVGVVRGEGKVINVGRRIITSEARITDAAGKLLAHGTSTLMVL